MKSWLLCLFILASCSGGSKGGARKESPAATKGLDGRVFDADTGRALAGVDVTTPSGATAKTDIEGRFRLQDKELVSRVDLAKPDYAGTTKEAARDAQVELFLKRVETSVEFPGERGVHVPLKSGGSVEIPPGAVTDDEGKPVTGMIKLQVASVSGGQREQSAALPKGDALARDGSRRRVGIEYAVDVKLTDAEGRRLTVRPGGKVVLELPAKAARAPEKQSGFSFDEQQGLWLQEKDLQRVTDDRGERVYRKELDHLSWHGFGQLFAQLSCLRACVQSAEGAPVAGAQVWLVGSSFSGVSSLFTGSDGCVVGDVPPAQELVLSAQAGGRASAPLQHVTSDVVHSATQDPAACESIAPLVLTREASSECPVGYELCGDACVDTATDREHCGSCAGVCAGAAGREQSCLAGVCGCPRGQTSCGDSCVDLVADPDHCGGCNMACNGGDACVAMTCTSAVACAPGFTRCGRDCADLSHSEARCGSCASACQPGELCLNSCVAPDAQVLCSNSAGPTCDDGLFCNGVALCSPGSNQALSNGCVLASSPCGQGACDEALNQCLLPGNGMGDAGQASADAATSCSPVESQAAFTTRPVDVIIALDTSASILSYFCTVSASLTAFMDSLGPDARVITLYEMGTLGPTSATLCGSADPLAASAIAQDATRYRHYPVTIDSLNALDQLLAQHPTYRGFLRPTAATQLVVVTDDNSPTTAAAFQPQMDTLLGHGFVSDVIVADGQNGCMGAAVGTQFLALADLTGGRRLSICSTPPAATTAALQASVQASRRSCQVGNVTSDLDRVQVLYQPNAGSKSELPRTTGAAGCGSNLAWYYQGSGVLLCPAACSVAQQGGQLTLGTGCAPLQL